MLEKDIKDLEQRNELLRKVEKEVQDYPGDKTFLTPYSFKEILQILTRNESMLELLKYFKERVPKKANNYIALPFGKYLEVSLDLSYDDLSLSFYMLSGPENTKLYDYVFNSWSGINEFIQDHVGPLFSVILGETNYSHSLGFYSFDLDYAMKRIKSFGYDKVRKGKDRIIESKSEIEEEVIYYKALIDYLVKLSKDEELMQDLDRIIETYLEVVFKRNVVD